MLSDWRKIPCGIVEFVDYWPRKTITTGTTSGNIHVAMHRNY